MLRLLLLVAAAAAAFVAGSDVLLRVRLRLLCPVLLPTASVLAAAVAAAAAAAAGASVGLDCWEVRSHTHKPQKECPLAGSSSDGILLCYLRRRQS